MPRRSPRPKGPPTRTSLHDRIVAEIGRRIVHGDYDSDGMLPTEGNLAVELGVSRNALREAMKVLIEQRYDRSQAEDRHSDSPSRRLESAGPRHFGLARRSALRQTRAFELVEFRLVVEPKAAYLAALRATEEEIAVIDANCSALEACVGYPDCSFLSATSPSTAVFTRHRTMRSSITWVR